MKQRLAVVARAAFSLVEMLVSVAVLGLLVLLVGQLFNGATLATTSVSKHIDCDTQARAVFERMAVDFSQILRRSDVDYFLKDAVNLQVGSGEGANDQMAYFSQVPGNIPAGVNLNNRSPLSLVAYRVESNPRSLQRMGHGLLWDTASPAGTPTGPSLMLFSPRSLSSGATVISQNWPAATDATPHPDYEPVGSDVFRMEYCYILKNPTAANGGPILDSNGNPLQSKLSSVPWDTRIPGHTTVDGLRDVSAIMVMLAIIDPKSRVTAQDADLQAMTKALPDFADGMLPGDLETTWRTTADAQQLPSVPPSAIRFYSRCFQLQ